MSRYVFMQKKEITIFLTHEHIFACTANSYLPTSASLDCVESHMLNLNVSFDISLKEQLIK